MEDEPPCGWLRQAVLHVRLHGLPVPDYVDENVSTKVVRIIQSYVGVVNKMVWRKF